MMSEVEIGFLENSHHVSINTDLLGDGDGVYVISAMTLRKIRDGKTPISELSDSVIRTIIRDYLIGLGL